VVEFAVEAFELAQLVTRQDDRDRAQCGPTPPTQGVVDATSMQTIP
jgi:hypothetical protein